MIIIDNALKARAAAGNPVKVGMIGAGFMGRGIANQIINSVPGMELVAISNRSIDGAKRAYSEAGIEDIEIVDSVGELESAIAQGKYTITEDAKIICQAEGIDAIIEVTGAVEFGAHVVMEAIAHRKHVIMMNAELDGTIGPILKVYADKAGVILSACDGDQPGVQMNLYRFVQSIGLTPLLCGNIKGLQDPYRNPTTQEGFAKRWGQKAHMVTSFADGSKISFEQAIVANATGMKVAKRGMLGYDFTGHVDEMTNMYDVEQLKQLGGIVDYVVGAKPGPGVYVFATHDDPKQRHYLNLYKLGEGPLYSFYTPYHLCHFEVPLSVARAVLFSDAVMAPLAGLSVDVITTAKIDLKAGETLDGIGYYMTYGQCENSDIVQQQNLLPMGLAEGCRLKRDIPKDQVLTYDDVELPEGRLCDQLRAEQDKYFAPEKVLVTVG
ncbi:3-hydroxyacyl-CoA dehydrogenase, NAD-binding protein [Trichormus variabilis ATCC 29413]|uniref:3-hydroxyacyl-CoA dehydrogenase, NAD-binding protein n=2 Tax=Anabaena variabilis TaxID=264691 RepID=Q3ME48_TRIV2|nr:MULTISPECIES: NAD(P)H-dependent oxidoreductase [Nostocaceae]ABA20738.1 3-hydroxyacyl-CoA dehydrogenase, NAD-binding protein [Trichormus variabilis ATCC 29413]MBC1215765.1 Gfo/Idh/MocA family oxidoreductase [Trichormus variabilis ARAD]MBC1254841.1 Gfo/Idh/MocA family oxidoreductase [Trichormus variabilis V5]MBC1267713.1 Gfo/Idh/MocA family oxidoreductase [Trichormus variabilis FSR]MBC1304344.1 Gfo/Idh/MocA family oxidoreductase [Trichormus variabilis N2B]